MQKVKAIIFDADGVLVNKPKVFSECLEEDYGIPASVTSKFFKGDFQNCLVGKADLKKELKSMKIKCYMGTNNEIYRTKYLERETFNSVFDKIFSSCNLGCKKPEKEFFEKVFAEISKGSKIAKSELLFVDDDFGNVEAAKQFGFQAFLYKNFPDFKRSISKFL